MTSLLIVIYIVFISLGLPDSLFGAAWPVIHTQFGISESFASVFSVIVGASTGAVSFLAGWFIRRFGTARVTFFSILLTVTGLIGISLSPNITVMIIFSIILGYGGGAIDTGLNNYVSLHYKAHHMNWLHCFWGVGVTASPIIISRFLTGEADSWRTGYRVIAAIQLCIAAIVLFSLKKWRKEESRLPETQAAAEHHARAGAGEILKTKGIIKSILSVALYCGMEFLVGTWGATYLVNVFALPPDSAARCVSLYFGGIMLGRLISGFISMRVSDKNMIRGGEAAALLGMIVLALPIGKAAVAGMLLIGMGFGPIFPSILHIIPSRFGAEYSADITGFHMGGGYALGFIIQLLFGYLASATTFKIMPFFLIAVCLLLMADNEAAVRAAKLGRAKKLPDANSSVR